MPSAAIAQARLALVQAQAARFADTAALFQALGGGWWNRIDVETNPLSPEDPDAATTDRSGRRRAWNKDGAQAMTKRMVIMLIAVAVVFGGIFGFQAFKAAMIKKFMSSMAAPPQTVSATKAELSEWQPKIEAVGSLRAVKGADLSLEVSGVVDSISFNSGDDVEEGALLLKLRAADDVGQARIAAGDGGAERDHLSSATRSSSRSRRSARRRSIPTRPT